MEALSIPKGVVVFGSPHVLRALPFSPFGRANIGSLSGELGDLVESVWWSEWGF